VQSSALELKRNGVSMEHAGKQIAAAMKNEVSRPARHGPDPDLC
jgi:hypothetical protein